MKKNEFLKWNDQVQIPAMLDRLPVFIRTMLLDESRSITKHEHLSICRETTPLCLLGKRLHIPVKYQNKIDDIIYALENRKHPERELMGNFVHEYLKPPIEKCRDYYLMKGHSDIVIDLSMMYCSREPNFGEDDEKYIIEYIKGWKQMWAEGFAVIPYICLDPEYHAKNGDNIFDLIVKLFTGYYDGFIPAGIKIYPPLRNNFITTDIDMCIWKFAEKQRIPCVSHCSSGTVHTSKHVFMKIEGAWKDSKGNWHTEPKRYFPFKWCWSEKSYSDLFCDPAQYEYIFKECPNIILQIAHYGGEASMKDYIKGITGTRVEVINKLLINYPGATTDVSFTNAYTELFDTMKSLIDSGIIGDKIENGFDWFMNIAKGDAEKINKEFVEAMGEKRIYKISNINPRKNLPL